MSKPKLSADQRRRQRTKRAEEAALALRESATYWTTSGVLTKRSVEVDSGVLLGTALTGAPNKYLRFDLRDAQPVKLPRTLLSQARRALTRWLRDGDLRAWVDSDGLHLRWRDGLGGLDFRPLVGGHYHDVARLSDCFAVDLRGAAREQAA